MMEFMMESSRERGSKCSLGQLSLFAYMNKQSRVNLANETPGEFNLKTLSIYNYWTTAMDIKLNGINLLNLRL